jgi:hypothetical protein
MLYGNIKGGMTVSYSKLIEFINALHFILHCGGNVLGKLSSSEIIWDIENNFFFITGTLLKIMSKTKIIWSQILPRKSLRYVQCNKTANETSMRVNSCTSTFVMELGVKTSITLKLQSTLCCLGQMAHICQTYVNIFLE